MPLKSTIAAECNVPIAMRDGTRLYADVYRPAGPGPYPTLLYRTPYDKTNVIPIQFILRALSRGYAITLEDVRGRFESDGIFQPFVNEGQDGYDTLEWLSAQSWCDGKVGMFGRSYIGLTQWQAAMSCHPILKAIAPAVTAADYHSGWTYQGGAFELSFCLSWTLFNLGIDAVKRAKKTDSPSEMEQLLDGIDDLSGRFAKLPLAGDPLLAEYAPYYDLWLNHPTYDDYWAGIDVTTKHNVMNVAALNIGGWYDIFLKGTLDNFMGMRESGRPTINERQSLLIGPWNHAGIVMGNPIGDYDFGIRSTGVQIDSDGIQLAWFDRCLRGADEYSYNQPPIQLFVMGSNQWRTEQEWPLARTVWQDWYLHSGGRANSLHGDGNLSPVGAEDEPPDSYVYNPRNPVPTRGGGLCCNPVFSQGGVYDQRSVEMRDDVLVYTSPPLDRSLEVTGPIRLILFASSTALDTDWTAKLVDVAPCGYARNLTDGILRARYRNSMRAGTLLVPGEVVRYDIDLWATSNTFLQGHRIRVEVSSSNFPRFDRNPNTGELPGRSQAMQSAMQNIYHNAGYPSMLVLPVIPSD